MDKKIYITTPIYYVNDVPHIGHAYTIIAADVLSRYYKSQNKEVFFLTGTDEHGAKIAEAAEKAGKEPKEFVDSLVPRFEKTWENLNIKYDAFIRTTDSKHEEVVKVLVSKLKEKGFVEKRSYEGLYCVGCERFLMEDELVDGKCPDHGKEPVKQSEENYFFLLSKFKDKLKSAIDKGEYEIAPKGRKNEVLGKIEEGLEDVSISRVAVEWGIPFPNDPKQTIYVWIDALINYYSAQKIFDQENVWPPTVHLMAKDILWFHAIVWPAVLMALDMPLPKKVFAHGFFTIDGKKMSKSVGNVLDPNQMVEKYGADAVRYALLREFPFGEDGDISEEKIRFRYSDELSNAIGNLFQRVIKMINSYQIKVELPKQSFHKKKYNRLSDREKKEYNSFLAELALISKFPESGDTDYSLKDLVSDYIEDIDFYSALDVIIGAVRGTNSFIEKNKPWQLAKEEKNSELKRVLNISYEMLNAFADLYTPFMPETAEKMKQQLETLKPEPLFPRLDK